MYPTNAIKADFYLFHFITFSCIDKFKLSTISKKGDYPDKLNGGLCYKR